MHRAEYAARGPVPQDQIACVPFELAPPGEGEVLLELLAAPIHPSDVLTITGHYGILPPLPAVGGNEGVGRVARLGPGVTSPAVGTVVFLPLGAGTWSSHLLAKATELVPLPAGVDPVQLSMVAVNPATALLMLTEFVALEPGEWVIQNAANSAVGGYLTQLAQARGLRTVNVVRRDAALTELELPDDSVALVDGPDLAARVQAATGGAKLRLAIDAVGGSATERLAQSLAPHGTVVVYGAMSGEAAKVSPASFIFRDVTVKGFWLARWFREAPPGRQQAVIGELVRGIAAGTLKARVAATVPLARIKEAVAMAASGARGGKVVVVP